jgi:hypothetical protein
MEYYFGVNIIQLSRRSHTIATYGAMLLRSLAQLVTAELAQSYRMLCLIIITALLAAIAGGICMIFGAMAVVHAIITLWPEIHIAQAYLIVGIIHLFIMGGCISLCFLLITRCSTSCHKLIQTFKQSIALLYK